MLLPLLPLEPALEDEAADLHLHGHAVRLLEVHDVTVARLHRVLHPHPWDLRAPFWVVDA